MSEYREGINERMAELAHTRAEKYPNVVMGLPCIDALPARTWIGTYSYSHPTSGTRWLEPEFTIYPFGVPQTVADSVRDYLDAKFSLPVRMRKAERAILDARPAPMLARPTLTLTDHVYLDIASAYMQIVRRVGWNCKYWPSEYVGRGDTLEDFPVWLHGRKQARAMLVSIGWPNPAVMWDGTKTVMLSTFSRFSNPALYVLVIDILRAVALDMVTRVKGVVYVNTDGYILPSSELDAARRVLADWKLESKIKAEGTCRVSGVGAYKVGKKKTEREGNFWPFDNFTPVDVAFLRETFSSFAR